MEPCYKKPRQKFCVDLFLRIEKFRGNKLLDPFTKNPAKSLKNNLAKINLSNTHTHAHIHTHTHTYTHTHARTHTHTHTHTHFSPNLPKPLNLYSNKLRGCPVKLFNFWTFYFFFVLTVPSILYKMKSVKAHIAFT